MLALAGASPSRVAAVSAARQCQLGARRKAAHVRGATTQARARKRSLHRRRSNRRCTRWVWRAGRCHGGTDGTGRRHWADLQLIDCALELVDVALQIGRLQLVLVQPRRRPIKLPQKPNQAESEGMPQRGGRVGSGGAARGDAATGLLRRADWCAGMCLRGQADGRKRAPRPTAEGHSRGTPRYSTGTPRYSTGTDLILVLLALSGLGAQVQDKLSRQPWLRAPPALTRAHAVSTARVWPQPVHAWHEQLARPSLASWRRHRFIKARGGVGLSSLFVLVRQFRVLLLRSLVESRQALEVGCDRRQLRA